MKQLLLPALAAFVGLATLAPAAAQTTFTNNTLETWVTRNGTEAPANWLTTDDGVRAAGFGSLLVLTGNTTGTVTKSTERHGGDFAARLESKNVALLGAALGGAVPGILALGQKLKPIDLTKLNTVAGLNNVGSGIAYTGRPTQLQFYYKLTGAGAATDLAGSGIGLFKTVDGVAQQVATGAIVLTPTTGADFQLATVDLTYTRTDAPDTLRLAFFSGSSATRTAGTVLLVDDVTLVTSVATPTRAALAATGLTVFPNPSAGGTFTLQAPDPALTAAAYTVFDATGRVVARAAAGSPAPGATRTIDLHEQRAGLYTLLLQTARGPLSQKLVVQ